MGVGISVIIPAYNESQRLPPYLQSVRAYLSGAWDGWYEVLVVDDGSEDGLWEVLQPLRDNWPQLVLLRHIVNRGKGPRYKPEYWQQAGNCSCLPTRMARLPSKRQARCTRRLNRGRMWR